MRKIINLYDLLRHMYCDTRVRILDPENNVMFAGETTEAIHSIDEKYGNTGYFEVYKIGALLHEEVKLKVYDRRKE